MEFSCIYGNLYMERDFIITLVFAMVSCYFILDQFNHIVQAAFFPFPKAFLLVSPFFFYVGMKHWNNMQLEVF